MAITDAFTDANGTLLEAHTSPGGETWTNMNVNTLAITGNQLATLGPASSSAVYKWNIAAVSADYSFSAKYLMPLASPNDFFFSLTVRGTNVGASFFGYVAIVSRVVGVLTLNINKDGSTLVSAAASSLDDGLVHTLQLTAQGGLLTLFVDGVKKLSAHDITYTTQSDTRINIRNASIGTPAGFYLDDTSVVAASAEPISTTVLQPLLTALRRQTPLMEVVAASPAFMLTGPHRNHQNDVRTNGGSSGTPVPIDGQLWPRGQKSG